MENSGYLFLVRANRKWFFFLKNVNSNRKTFGELEACGDTREGENESVL